MALTIANVVQGVSGNKRTATFDITFDSSYAFGGESIDKTLLGFASEISTLSIDNKDGYKFEFDKTNSKVVVNDKPFAETKVVLTDDDSAASKGVALYLHVDETFEQGANTGHIEFVSPTNADGTGTAYSGGPTYYIQDDDAAATGGTQIYFDEDATLGSRLVANIARTTYVEIGGGRRIRVTKDASASSNGVAVYFDEDATNSYARLLFVSPTNASGYDVTSAEVDSATDLSALTVTATATGV